MICDKRQNFMVFTFPDRSLQDQEGFKPLNFYSEAIIFTKLRAGRQFVIMDAKLLCIDIAH